MADSVTELTAQIAALQDALRADPDNPTLPPLISELTEAKRALQAALDAPPARPAALCCSILVHGRERVGRLLSDSEGVVRVVFLGVNIVKDFPNNDPAVPIKYLNAVPTGVFPGAKLEAVFEADGLWYPCTVVKRLPENRAVVRFDGFNEEVQISLTFLRQRQEPVAVSVEQEGPEHVTPGGYRIPGSLQIEAGDSERVRQTKRRKIAQVKNEQRQGKGEIKAEQSKQSWQNFKTSL